MKQLDKKGWKRVRFGDVCRNLNVTVKSPEENGYDKVIGLENIESGNLHIKTWGDISEGTTFTKTFEPGHVLFGKRRAYLKKAAMAEFKGLCSGDILVFEAIDKVLHPKLLPFIVSSNRFFEYAVKTSAGSLSPRTKFQDLANFEFSLPPIEQQQKLAELLLAGDELHSNLKLLVKAIKTIKNVYFNLTFKDLIDEIKISDLGEIITGSTPSTKNPIFWDGEIQFVTPSDIEIQKRVKKTERYITELGLYETRTIPPNSVMVVCIASIGKIALSTERCATNQQINSIIPNPNIDSLYIYHLLNYFKNRIIGRAANSVVPILNKGEFGLIPLPNLEKDKRDIFTKKAEFLDKLIESGELQINKTSQILSELINKFI